MVPDNRNLDLRNLAMEVDRIRPPMSVTIHSILHVEDDLNDVLLLQRAVRRAGLPIGVTSVPDGESAIAYLNGDRTYSDRRLYPLPDLVLLDLKIPRKSGLEVLSWIRMHPQFKRLPVTVLTSSRHDRDMEQAYDTGANSYLVKPVGFDALLQMITVVNTYWFSLNQRPVT
jgi:CheY-like chemotaxis protein